MNSEKSINGNIGSLFFAGKTGVVMEETNKGVMMEEKKPNKVWKWINDHPVIVGGIIGGAAAFVAISKGSSRSRKELNQMFVDALRNGNMVAFLPNGSIEIIPPKVS